MSIRIQNDQELRNVAALWPSKAGKKFQNKYFTLRQPNGYPEIEVTTPTVDVTYLPQCDQKGTEFTEYSIHRRTFQSLLAITKGQELRISQGTDGRVKIKTPSITMALEQEKLPDGVVRQVTLGSKVLAITTVGVKALKQALSQVAFCASKDTTRLALTGVQMEFFGCHLLLAATDTHRLATKVLEVVQNLTEVVHCIIPMEVVQMLLRYKTREETLTITVKDHGQLAFSFGNLVINTVHGADFPKWRRVVPESHTTCITVEADEVIDRLKALALVYGFRGSKRVKFKIVDRSLKLSAPGDGCGEAECNEAIRVGHSGDDLVVDFNADYLLDAIHVFKGQSVNWEFNGDKQPMRMVTVGDSYQYVVMPMVRT